MVLYNDYLNECKNATTPLVGHLAMVSISDQPVDRDQLVHNLQKHNVTTTHVPAPTREVDAWKKACATINGTKFPTRDDNKVTYLVREIKNDVRAVMQEVTDKDNRRLSYRPVATTTVTAPTRSSGKTVRGTGSWHWLDYAPDGSPVDLDDSAIVQVAALKDKFEEVARTTYTMLDGSRMRRTVLGILESLNAFEIRPSVYFIPVKSVETLTNLTVALQETTSAVRLILVPLIDSATQRQLVIEAYQTESQDQMQALLKSTLEYIQQAKTGTNIRYATVTALFDRYREQVERAKVYAVEMEMGIGHLRETSEMTLQALQSLRDLL